MSARACKWEIVQSDAGFHARFRSSNGRIIVTSEQYERRRDAVHAVSLVGDAPSYSNGPDADLVEVRDVDERTPPPPLPSITARAFGGWI